MDCVRKYAGLVLLDMKFSTQGWLTGECWLDSYIASLSLGAIDMLEPEFYTRVLMEATDRPMYGRVAPVWYKKHIHTGTMEELALYTYNMYDRTATDSVKELIHARVIYWKEVARNHMKNLGVGK